MNINDTLASIPIKTIPPPAARSHWKRRAAQIITMLVIVLIPVSGLFRIDLQAGNFIILGRQIWWSDYSLMLGFWIMLATLAVMTYSTIGTVWCGWACPQNTFSEWVNQITFKLLGKRASVRIDSEKTRVAAAKNKLANWLALGVSILLISLALAIIPFLYIYPPGAVWSMLTFQPDARLPNFTHYLYLVATFAIFIDIALIRHVVCRYFCLYRMWQHIFKTRQTLHVEYDASRSADCEKCNYCETSCFIDLNPTQFSVYDTCINCGECIDACNNLHARESKAGLLHFEFGSKRRASSWRESVDNLVPRLGWTGVLFIVGAALFAWGFAHYSPYEIAASRAYNLSGAANDYQIQVANKVYTPGEVTLTVKGIPADSYKLDTDTVKLDSAARVNVPLRISPQLSKGLHRIIIEAQAPDGWTAQSTVEHYAAGGG
ncbi:MAG: 4Fe-4S binding protein [Gallionellaceae bacterium]|jgi:polyferredoxin|nr:4Fe-4S binding protein [Gallionellaceae bacterium]